MRLWGLLLGVLWGCAPLVANPWQPFTALTVSADARFFATGGAEGEVLWWELSTGEVVGKWQLSPRPVAGLAFDAPGERLVALVLGEGPVLLSGPDQGPRGLDPADPLGAALVGATQRWLTMGPPMSGVVATLGSSTARGFPDGSIVVSWPSVPSLRWDAHAGAVTGLVWIGSGERLLSCSYDGSLALWDPRTGKLLSRL